MLNRIMGVLTLKAPVYREIADDASATGSAALVVIVAMLISGFFGGLVRATAGGRSGTVDIAFAILGGIVTVLLGLVSWFITGWLLGLIANGLGGKTNTGEMLRVTGYNHAFRFIEVLRVLTAISFLLSCIVAPIQIVVAILSIVGLTIGIREAAEFSTGKAILTAVIAFVIGLLIVTVLGGIIIGAAVTIFHFAR